MNDGVPLVYNWLTPALLKWRRAVYPPRGGGFFVAGCLFIWIALLVIGIKGAIFWGVVFSMVIAFMLSASYDLITYHWRKRRALRREFEDVVNDL